MMKIQWLLATIALTASFSPVAEDVPRSECLSYWQLRSVGLSREYGVESAKLSNRYHQQYQVMLASMKKHTDPQTLVAEMYQSMAKLMRQIDSDYDRTAELDAQYYALCSLDGK